MQRFNLFIKFAPKARVVYFIHSESHLHLIQPDTSIVLF